MKQAQGTPLNRWRRILGWSAVACLALSKLGIVIVETPRLLDGQTENFTFFLMINGALYPAIEASMILKSYKLKEKEEKHVFWTVLFLIITTLYFAGFAFPEFIIQRKRLGQHIVTLYDAMTVIIIAIGFITVSVRSYVQKKKFTLKDPIIKGRMMAFVVTAVQVPIAVSILIVGSGSLNPLTLFLGYLISFIKLGGITDTVKKSGEIESRSKKQKHGMRIIEWTFIVNWTIVTLCYCHKEFMP